MVVQFHIVFRRIMRNSINDVNDGMMVVNAIQTYRVERNKPSYFVEFWQVVIRSDK